jgi:hypothetical protein
VGDFSRDNLEPRDPGLQKRIDEGGGENGAAGSPAAGPGVRRGCNVVISDKRFPGDTHCAPLAASNPAWASFGACRAMFTHTRARVTSPLVTVHYVANRDISPQDATLVDVKRPRVSRRDLSSIAFHRSRVGSASRKIEIDFSTARHLKVALRRSAPEARNFRTDSSYSLTDFCLGSKESSASITDASVNIKVALFLFERIHESSSFMHLAFIAPSDQLEHHHLVFLIVFMGLASVRDSVSSP